MIPPDRGVGHTRLAIYMLSGARQPLLAPRARLWIVVGVMLSLVSPAWSGSAHARRPTGLTVEEERPATANHMHRPIASNSPQLAVDPTDAEVMAMANRLDAPDFGCALQLSGDGGRGWVPAAPVPTLPPGAEKCYGPDVAFDGRGVLYYLFVGLAGKTNVPMGAFLTTSSDRGRHFSSPRQVLGPHNFAVHLGIDASFGDRGRIHLVWLAANTEPSLGSLPDPPNPVLAAHSDDGAKSFSSPVQVSDPTRAFVVAPTVTVGPDHAVHVLYYDLGDDARDYHGLEGPAWDRPWSLVVSSSADGGGHFRPGVVVDADVVAPERVMLIFTLPAPSIVADSGGRVFVAWHDARNGDWDAFLRRSPDGGRTWAPPLRLNDDPVGNGRHQYQPRLSVAPGGRLDAVFYDRRDDADNVRNHVYYTFSTDGGRRFAPNHRLTTKPSDSRVGQTYVGKAAEGLVEFGSRLGLASLDGRAVAAWTDTRNAFRLQQDVFSTVVDQPAPANSSRSSNSWRWAVGIALGVAGVAAVAVALSRRARRRGEPSPP